MSQSIRTFIAVEIPPEVRDHARKVVEKLRAAPTKVKWVDTKLLHWTMNFLGDVDLRLVPRICQNISEAVAEMPPFDVEAFGIGAFPTVDRPRTVWLGVRAGAEEMVTLHDAIDRALEPLGFRPENRRFRPHVTLGRVRSIDAGTRELARLITEHAEFDGGLSTVFEVTIFSSELGRDGPTYEPMGHAELKGRIDER